MISKLKQSGVTSVILQADPIAPATFTQEATAQEYFPEWIVAGGTLVDTNTFGRVFDQAQWEHAFGITARRAPRSDHHAPASALYEWFHGSPPPAAETAPICSPARRPASPIIQAAGPNLTPETFRDGLFAVTPTQRSITQPSLSWGDHGLWDDLGADWSGVDDMSEWWWDPDRRRARTSSSARATGHDALRRRREAVPAWTDPERRQTRAVQARRGGDHPGQAPRRRDPSTCPSPAKGS